MKKYKALVMSIAITALGLNSCKKGCTDPSATNFDERAKKDDNSCEYEDPDSYTVPSTYAFVDADGNSTVSYSGQFQRLDMLSEMITYMKTANTQGVFVDAQTLKDMYENNSYTWTDNNSLGMTGSTKQLKTKRLMLLQAVQLTLEYKPYLKLIWTVWILSVITIKLGLLELQEFGQMMVKKDPI